MIRLLLIIFLLGCQIAFANTGSAVSNSVVLDTANPIVAALSPLGNLYHTGDTVNITWSALDTHPQSSPIKVEWHASYPSPGINISASEVNDGVYTWTVPNGYTEQAQVRITMTDTYGNIGTCSTSNFTILPGDSFSTSAVVCLDTANPVLTIISPATDSIYVRNEALPICWTSIETNPIPNNLSIDWQRNSTAVWNVISTNEANDGTYIWITPTDSTHAACVRLRMTDAFGNIGTGISQSFMITAPFADFVANDTSGFVPLSVQFTDKSKGQVVSWQWDFDQDGLIDSDEQAPSWTYVFPWEYTVSLSVTFADGSRQSVRRDINSKIKTAYIQPTIDPTRLIQVPGNYNTIQSAIDAASDGDYIIVANGTYFENLQIVGKEITLASQYFIDGDSLHIDNTVIDGSQTRNRNESSVIAIRPGTSPGLSSNIVGFTITHGSGRIISQNQGGIVLQKIVGGGLFIEGSNPIITKNKVVENDADDEGGGSYAMYGLPNIGGFVTSGRMNPGGNVFRNNRADLGKDIYINGTGVRDEIQAENCSFSVFCAQDTTVTAYWTTSSAPVSFSGSHGQNAALANDIWVATDGSDFLNTGTSQDSPFLTIDHALSLAYGSRSNPIVIHLAPGTYAPSQTGERYPLQMVSWVSLEGAGMNETYLDAEASDGSPNRVINLDKVQGCQIRNLSIQGGVVTAEKGTNGAGIAGFDSEFQLSNLTCSGLSAAGDGAGIYLLNSLTVCDSLVVSGNWAENNGGGIYARLGNASINNSDIRLNNSHNGGGLYITENKLTMDGCIVESNQTSGTQRRGGGLYLAISDSSRITKSIFKSNIADFGAGMFLQNATHLQVIGNRIINNIQNTTLSANGGGGIYWNNSTTGVVANNLIANNTAYQGGAGFGLSPLNFYNNTITNNRATYKGGGFYLNACSPLFLNTILWGNAANSGGNQIYLQTNSSDPSLSYCDVQGGTSAFGLSTGTYTGIYLNNQSSDPIFESPSLGAGNNHDALSANWELQATSPCRDAGDPQTSTTVFPFDLNHQPRIRNTVIDQGAFEYQVVLAIDSPQNIKIELVGTVLTISWDKVPDANSYKVFSDAAATGTFTEEISNTEGEFHLYEHNVSWTTMINSNTKRFFKIQASTDNPGIPVNLSK